jgi:hypothetical protein
MIFPSFFLKKRGVLQQTFDFIPAWVAPGRISGCPCFRGTIYTGKPWKTPYFMVN